MLTAVTRAAVAAGTEVPDDDSGGLVGAARSAREEGSEQLEKIRLELISAEASTGKTQAAIESLRAEVDVPVETSISQAVANAEGDRKVARAGLERLTEDKKASAKLLEVRAGHAARRQIYNTVADDMRPVKFLAYLLEERLQLLVALGSDRLREMTGRYRFSLDRKQTLQVVDELSADAERPVGSLSGGETFLASLALALALADLVAREGGRLECFFLDEGFGSLDPESFDMAMDGIEHLVSGDRLIGLVSHVEALKARVEDKIVLTKAADGTTVVDDDPGDLIAALSS